MGKKIVMGIDAGTGGVRVGLYTLQGEEIIFATTEYKTYHQNPGWAEQKPSDWWDCLCQSSKKAIETAGVDKEDIVSLSLDTTCCSVVMCMNDGTPLRDSLIWMDVRAAEEAELITKCEDPALKFNGYGNVSPEWMPCKALWLKKNEPENYAKAEKVCEFTDWYMYKLTGKWVGNLNNCACRWYYDAYNGGFPKSLYEKIGLLDVLDKFPQEIVPVGTNMGTISPEAAAQLGLSEKTIVGMGGVDAFIGMLGLGVVKPGSIALITGSSHLILGFTDVLKYANGMFGPYPEAVVPDYSIIEGGQTSTGSIISWFKNNFCQDLIEKGKKEGKSAFDYLNEEAEKLEPGSDGLVALDFWQGNRTPYTDPNVRGMVYGFSLSHTRVHMYRAIMEAIAYGTENVFATFRENGVPVNEIYLGGGASNSDLFLQIHADVSNVVINVPENIQTPCVGSAILAAVAAGCYETIEEAANHMVKFSKIIEPNKENHEKYKQIFARYRAAYPEAGNWMRETTKACTNLNKE